MKYYLAVDIGGTAIKWAVIDQDYHIRNRGEYPTPYDGPEKIVEVIAMIVGMQIESISAIGVSVPGTVPQHSDRIIYGGGVLTFLDKIPLGKLIKEATGLPCHIENDGKCCALGEYSVGALKGSKIGIVIVIGTGIGGGIVINGQVFKGAHDFAGEFSFICAKPELGLTEGNEFGKACGWKSGLQALVVQKKQIQTDCDLDGHRIFELIHAGDGEAIEALEIYCERLAMQINNLQVVLDPEVIAIGGGISGQPVLFETLQKRLDKMYDETVWKHIPRAKIVRCKHGNDANLFGAIYPVMN